MKPVPLLVESTDAIEGKCAGCAECGWPGVGTMPAGVRIVNENGSQRLVGQLSYIYIRTRLCSVCQEMADTVQRKPWFVDAHSEYLNEIELKRKLLAGR
jgi:hypothetical protein